MKMISGLLVALVMVLGLSVPAHQALAVPIVSHSDATDPTTEGWYETRFVDTTINYGHNNAGVSVGTIYGDGGFDAWVVDDTSTADGSNDGYAYFLTATELNDALTYGFVLSTRLKNPDYGDSGPGSILVVFDTGTKRYNMAFMSDAEGDPIVTLLDGQSNPTYTIEGVGPGYHLYDLVFDPLTSSASLFVDGIERISGWSGRDMPSYQDPYIFWGSGQDNDVGEGRYNLVEFSVNPAPVPEPSTMLLLGSGLAGLVGLGRRFKVKTS